MPDTGHAVILLVRHAAQRPHDVVWRVMLSGVITSANFIYGIQYEFIPYYVTYSLIKTVFFAFIITSISSFQGYYVNGGSLEVGRASTKAVVYSSVLILLFNVILTQLLLS